MSRTPHQLLLAFFFFNDTATTEIYTLSLHDALPISRLGLRLRDDRHGRGSRGFTLRRPRGKSTGAGRRVPQDRKSTRLNSSHSQISYAVFCLKKKKEGSHPRRSRHPHPTDAHNAALT